MFVFNTWECDKVIIFGSSKNLITANYWQKKPYTAFVMMNWAWHIREKNNDWDKIICTKEYLNGDEGDKDIKAHIDEMPRRWGEYQFLYYYPTLRNRYFGPMKGNIDQGTMFFNAVYYSIEMYQPEKIGFIGCDMDYEKHPEGDTGFMGDHKPDPFISLGGKYEVVKRLEIMEKFCEKENIELVNLSTADWTFLPFKREEYEHF
tara:strand:- start:154 stop:765 length:612 start_codon:yes stop_codon:yes gene_type:complete